jgi:hypothetical protein
MRRWWLAALFAVVTGFRLTIYIVVPANLGIDARVYVAAAGAWVDGGDPWSASANGVLFAAPPTSFLPFVPFVGLDPRVTAAAWIVGCLVVAALAIRSLHLPLWWVAFPPVADGIMVGSLDVVVLGLLVIWRGRLGALAPLLKIYALIPMLGERRWRDVLIAGGLLAASLLVLPWGDWFARLPEISANLAQTSASTSVYGSPVLMVVGVMGLAVIGLPRAGWLAVPVLWPSTQPHYMAVSVPGLVPFIAAVWCFPHPLVTLGSVVAYALHLHRERLIRVGR